MRLFRLSFRRVLLLGALLLVAAGIIAPYLHANRFKQRIGQALEESLNRKVDIEDVRFNLFRGPGFSLRKVVIQEDPAMGIEPFAYVDSIEARLKLSSFFTGRLEFSSLRIVDASVNLAKAAAGTWNFQPLLGRMSGEDLPEIHVRGGRLNFKFGDAKSVFYFANTDLDLVPPSHPGEQFALAFSGEPGRTDRAAHGFGELAGRGRWQPSHDAEGRLELNLNLEKSAIAEVVTLIHGYDIGVHGLVASRARLRGPLSDLEINGSLELEEIHRWDLMPPYAQGGPMNYRGRLDLRSQHFELETVPSENSAVAVRLEGSSYLSRPRWNVSLTLNRLPLSPVVDVARHMGLPLAPDLGIDGSMVGVIGYSPGRGFEGQLQLYDALVRMRETAPIRFEDVRLLLDGYRVRVSQALVHTQRSGEALRVHADYFLDAPRLDARIEIGSLSVATARSEARPLLGATALPFLDRFREGTFDGWLRYRQAADLPGEWTGSLRLHGTQLSVPGLARPFVFANANLSLQGSRITVKNIRAHLGEAEIQGEYRYEPDSNRRHHFRLLIPELQAAELERLLMPTLRRRRGFLSRTLGLGRTPLPEWLENRHAEGVLEIGRLSLRDLQFGRVHIRLFWDGTVLEITSLKARLQGGQFAGHLSVNLGGPAPEYQGGGRIEGISWLGGRMDGDGVLKTTGMGTDLLLNLRAQGAFYGRSIEFGPDTQFKTASGCYDLAWKRGQPELKLQALRLVTGREVFLGRGATLEDGTLRIEISNGGQQMRLAGKLAPFQLEVEMAR
jgi:hypothetical protein